MRVLIILNPASGKSTGNSTLEAVNRQFTNSKVDFEIYESKKGDDLGYGRSCSPKRWFQIGGGCWWRWDGI